MNFFLLFLYKIGELENRTGSAWEWRVGINGIEWRWGNGEGG
jgi:hypothetical protein